MPAPTPFFRYCPSAWYEQVRCLGSAARPDHLLCAAVADLLAAVLPDRIGGGGPVASAQIVRCYSVYLIS